MREFVLRVDGEVVTQRLEKASNPWTRMRGLLGRSELPDDRGLWITPCPSIHMFFMRFAIDAVFLDRDLRVVKVVDSIAPGATAKGGKRARSVLELPPGTAARAGLAAGTQVTIDPN